MRLRAHDLSALGEFLKRHHHALLAFVERRLGSALRGKIEPQDVLQELAVKALRDLPKSDLTTLAPCSWLCHLAEQCIVDEHRRFSAGKRDADRETPGNVP